MTGSEVATPEGGVPALRHDPASQITAADIALPRLYIAQDMHNAVQSEQVKRGQIFTASGKDDPDPVVVAGRGPSLDGKAEDTKGLNFFVLGLRKGWSWTHPETRDLKTWAFTDPERHPKAWTTYMYLLALPSVDEILPYRFLLTRSNKGTAQRINQKLALTAGTKPPYANGFNLTTKETQNDAGRFYVAVVKPIEPTDEELAVARQQYEQFADALASPRNDEFNAPSDSDEPTI